MAASEISSRGLTIPASAMLYRETAPKVATVGADNHIVLKELRVERDLGTTVEIIGLSPGERIVANPPDSIADGEEVRVMEAAGEKTPAPAERQGAVRPRNPESFTSSRICSCGDIFLPSGKSLGWMASAFLSAS